MSSKSIGYLGAAVASSFLVFWLFALLLGMPYLLRLALIAVAAAGTFVFIVFDRKARREPGY